MGSEKNKLVVAFPALDDDRKRKIEDHVSAKGYQAVFCIDQETALSEAADAKIIFGMNAALAKAGKGIKWVCTPSAGVDHFLKVLKDKDIILSNSSGAYGLTIAEHIVMVTLEIMRRRPEYVELARKRVWEHDLAINSIHGARITLVATGWI